MLAAVGNSNARRHRLEDWLQEWEYERASRSDSENNGTFRLFLERTGPVFAAFGQYLSSRCDIVPELLGEELTKISNAVMPSAPSEILHAFQRDLGCSPERAFAGFDSEPFQSRLFWQTHNARLADQDVIVRIIHPDIEERLSDSDDLSLLEQPLSALGMGSAGFEDAMADFRRLLSTGQTLESELEAARLFAQDSQSFDLLGAQRIFTHLSGKHVAVYARWRSFEAPAVPAPDLARFLCTAWLRQSLCGSVYPVDPGFDNVGFSLEGRIVFPSGTFATLPEALKTSLWSYLVALAMDNVDDAAKHLATALGIALTDRNHEDLQRQIRQMVPFRDGFCDKARSWPPFSEQVLIHWRIANKKCRMSEPLVSFYRSLLTVTKTTRVLAPGSDSLLDALRDLRLLTALDQVKNVMQPSRMAALVEDHIETFVGMPERWDRFLTFSAKGAVPAIHGRAAGAQEDNANNRYVRVLCLLLALAAAGTLFHKIAGSAGANGRAAAVVFLAFGLYVLFAGTR